MERVPSHETGRWLVFGAAITASLALFCNVLAEIVHLGLANDDASHVLLIPFISAWLIYIERQRIFRTTRYDGASSAVFFAAAAALYAWTWQASANWSDNNRLTGYSLALVLLWAGVFAVCFGRNSLRAAQFPLLFLLLSVPLPDFLLNPIVYALQKGSADLTALLFDMLNVPFLRNGFVFHLARVNIEVARECSGIRSSMALLILALLVVHFTLRSTWRQIVFVAAGMVVMIVKNGVRIVTLTLLASYVNPDFLFGRLHREGGVVFFVLGVLLLVPLLWWLQRGESRRQAPSKTVEA
ncbi:MAG: hypothetical protein NVS9B4_18620 [Candidatus Acidiferrum sp.]